MVGVLTWHLVSCEENMLFPSDILPWIKVFLTFLNHFFWQFEVVEQVVPGVLGLKSILQMQMTQNVKLIS